MTDFCDLAAEALTTPAEAKKRLSQAGKSFGRSKAIAGGKKPQAIAKAKSRALPPRYCPQRRSR
jgi:hypothetical protein